MRMTRQWRYMLRNRKSLSVRIERSISGGRRRRAGGEGARLDRGDAALFGPAAGLADQILDHQADQVAHRFVREAARSTPGRRSSTLRKASPTIGSDDRGRRR